MKLTTTREWEVSPETILDALRFYGYAVPEGSTMKPWWGLIGTDAPPKVYRIRSSETEEVHAVRGASPGIAGGQGRS